MNFFCTKFIVFLFLIFTIFISPTLENDSNFLKKPQDKSIQTENEILDKEKQEKKDILQNEEEQIKNLEKAILL